MHKGWERRSWKGQRAGRRKSQNKPRIAHSLPSRLMFLTERGFPRLAWGGCRLAPSRARGSPTPWASAIIPLAGPRPLGRSNLLGQEKETSGGRGGRTSVQGLRAAPRARLLAPFFFYIHRPAHAPTGAARAEVHPTGDPYRPRGARRKPRPIRALARECARARAGPAASANWVRGLGRPVLRGGRSGSSAAWAEGRECLSLRTGPQGSSSWQAVGDALLTTASLGAGRLELLFSLCYFCISCVYTSRPRGKLQANAYLSASTKKRNQN